MRVGGVLDREDWDRLSAVVLSLTLILLFAFTAAVTRRYRTYEAELAARFRREGTDALRSGRPADAVASFRSAVFYARHDDEGQFLLAQALLAAGRAHEARPYLDQLWQHDPSRGVVNLELARLHAAAGATADAVRHYQGAIHGAWEPGEERRRREAQWELIGYLRAAGDTRRTVAELGVLATGLRDDDGPGHVEVASWFLALGEPRLALRSFRKALAVDPSIGKALAGAGEAAAALGEWRTARDFLRRIARGDRDDATERRLETAELVLALDPWAPRLTSTERSRRARAVADALRGRLLCAAPAAVALRSQVESLAPGLETSALRRDPEAVDALFDVEIAADALGQACPAERPVDHALRALAQRRRAEEEHDDGR